MPPPASVRPLRPGRVPSRCQSRRASKVNSEGVGSGLSALSGNPAKESPFRDTSTTSMGENPQDNQRSTDSSSVNTNGMTRAEDAETQALPDRRSSSAHAETPAHPGSGGDRKPRHKVKAGLIQPKAQASAEGTSLAESAEAFSLNSDKEQGSASLNGTGPPRTVPERDTRPGALHILEEAWTCMPTFTTDHNAGFCSQVAENMLLSLLAVPLLMVSRPLPRVLCLHTGGTLGMDAEQSYEPDGVDGHVHLKPGTGGSFSPAGALRPGQCCLAVHSPGRAAFLCCCLGCKF